MASTPDPNFQPLHIAGVSALDNGVGIVVAGKAAPEPLYPQLLTWLRAEERERLLRFKNKAQHAVYLSAHATLNALLGGCTKKDIAQLAFALGPERKPYLMPPEHGLYFNLSHSGNYFLIGLVKNREIGVDVEVHRANVRTTILANRFFHPNEQVVAQEGNRSVFFDIWSRKEAYLKALGTGLAYPTAAFDATGAHLENGSKAISIESLPFCEGASAAMAIEGERLPLQKYRLWSEHVWSSFLLQINAL